MARLSATVPVAGSRSAVEGVAEQRRRAARVLRPVLLLAWGPSLVLLAWQLLVRDAGGPLWVRATVVLVTAAIFGLAARWIPRGVDPPGALLARVRDANHADEDAWLACEVVLQRDVPDAPAADLLVHLPRRAQRVPEPGEHVIVQPDRGGRLEVALVDPRRAVALGLRRGCVE